MRHVLLIASFASFIGQGCGDPPPRPRGIENLHGASGASAAEGPPTTEAVIVAPRHDPIAPVEPAPVVVTETVVTPQEAPRDLSYELHQAFGDPLACFGALPGTVRSVSIDVSVILFDDGVTSGGHASSSYRTPEIDACLRRRLSGLQLRGGVRDAPRTVSTRLELVR